MYRYGLNGKIAMVTGAASGLGNEYVETLAGQGCDVALVDFDYEKAKKEAQRIAENTGKRIRPYFCDVGSEEAVIQTVSEIVQDFGRIDILVNNAGILLYGPKEEGKDPYMDYSVETWDRVMRTNITGPWLVTREVVKQSMQFLGGGRDPVYGGWLPQLSRVQGGRDYADGVPGGGACPLRDSGQCHLSGLHRKWNHVFPFRDGVRR